MQPVPASVPLPAAQLRWLLPALAAVALLRLWRLPEASLADFDSVRNWQIVQQVAHLDFGQIFRHGSPAFYLLYAPVAWFSTDYRVFLVLNALVAVAALGLLTDWIARAARLPGPEIALLVMLTGSSVFLTASGRDFIMSSWSLLALTGLLRAHWQRLHHPSRATLLRTAAWLAFGLSINYKFLLTLPILAVLEVQQHDGLLTRSGNWWRVLLVLAAPFVVLSVVAWAVSGVPVYRWPAVYVSILFPGANAAGRGGIAQATRDLDLSYYFRFLAAFETPLLLPALAAGLVWFGGGVRQRPLPIATYLLVWAVCILAGMSLLYKAPRGLLFGFVPMYGLVVLVLRQWLARPITVVALLAAIGYNVWQLQREVYAYLPTRYPQVAAWLHQHGIQRVATTVGIGLVPAAQRYGIAVTPATTGAQLRALRRQGYHYLLLDDYHRVTNVRAFDSLRAVPPVAAWPEPPLTAPLLYLEHSEFTGLGYRATLARQQQAAHDSVQLRLIPLR
ncbi:hypothetical protein F0P96_05480 [Hymenobacter busanensis]|uniref:Uncharacterized protein n=1 Tax=Hymenobacter busanensis TaxID=2607656 RepID=A0A7L5A2E7_9BACT|nr:hypothetical protein [Hymenobacter busanensis]KAA9338290.1 hypothetical protein F0P96_05480 [Hymenobacter busanensis]QHJ09286.1 hypothetical protein GUY19_19130 [Hymenobacter busanensis]